MGAANPILSDTFHQFTETCFLDISVEYVMNLHITMSSGLFALPASSKNFQKNVEGCVKDWYRPILILAQTCLNGVFRTALVTKLISKAVETTKLFMENTRGVLVQSGGPGYETSAIFVALVQIICDPFYRTYAGFCALVEKEFTKHTYAFLSIRPLWPILLV